MQHTVKEEEKIMNEHKQKIPYQKIIEKLWKIEATFRQIADVTVKDAFPLTESPRGSDGQFHHASTDFANMNRFYSEIPDAMLGYECIQQLDENFRSLLVIVEDLYPKEYKTGAMKVENENKFTSITTMINEVLAKLKEIGDRISGGQSSAASIALNLEELRKMAETMAVKGWEYIHNQQVPSIFRFKKYTVPSKKSLENLDRTFYPQISNFAHSEFVNSKLSPRTKQLIDQLRNIQKGM